MSDGRIPVGLDSWAKCLRCAGYLQERSRGNGTIRGRCESCGEITRFYDRSVNDPNYRPLHPPVEGEAMSESVCEFCGVSESKAADRLCTQRPGEHRRFVASDRLPAVR